MINKAILLFLTLALSAFSGSSKSLFVKSGVNGGDGTSWTKAWASPAQINWGSCASGDTIYIAGGTYTGTCTIGKAGVTLLRVKSSDTAATQAAGWQASFDSTVVINVAKGTAGIVSNGSNGDNTTIDGRQAGGIVINIVDNSSGIGFSGQAPRNVTIRYVNTVGPGKITQTGDVRGMDLTPNSGPMTNLKIQYCDLGHGGDSGIYMLYGDGVLIEHCDFHDFDAINAASYHQNLIYCGSIINSVFRFNRFFDIQTESLFFGDPNNRNIEIYANLFYQGSIPLNTGRTLQFDNASNNNTSIHVINNTFVATPLGTQLGPQATFSGCRFENNLSYKQTTTLGSGWTDKNNLVPTSDPFVDAANFNYRLKASNGAAANLGAPYNIDFDGNTRPASGAWDAGAFQFKSGGTPTPTPTAAPTATPSATPEPTPTPAAKFAVGDHVVTVTTALNGGTTNIRATPGGTLLGSHPAGEPGVIQAGPQDAPLNGANVVWYQAVFGSLPNGWCGDDNLEKSAAPSPTPTPQPTATPSPTPPPGPTYESWIQKQNSWIRANPPTAD